MSLMNPRHTEHLFTISTELAPEQIGTILRKVSFIEPTAPFSSYQRYHHYHYDDVLFDGTLLPEGFALRRLSMHPFLYPYLIGRFRETPIGTDIDVCYNSRHFTEVAFLTGAFGMPLVLIPAIGLFLGWWDGVSRAITLGSVMLLPLVIYCFVRWNHRERVVQDRRVLTRILVPASLESDGWVRNVINERIWGSRVYGVGECAGRTAPKKRPGYMHHPRKN